MRPFDQAWRLLKNYTKPSPVRLPELGETDVERNPPISQHLIDDDNNEQLFHYRMGQDTVDPLDSDKKHDFDNQRLRLLLANMFTSQPPYDRQVNPPTLDTGMEELTREDVEQYYSGDRQQPM
tara:strand:- start:335 stop:703 length:369 start_codon:yes stop_codon:yes gene_type:complete